MELTVVMHLLVPIYAAENSPAAVRGALVMTWRTYNKVPLSSILGASSI